MIYLLFLSINIYISSSYFDWIPYIGLSEKEMNDRHNITSVPVAILFEQNEKVTILLKFLSFFYK